MLFRRILVGLVFAMIFAIMAACGNDSKNADPGTPPQPVTEQPNEAKVETPPPAPTPPPEKKDPVELIFYSQVPDYDETFHETFGKMIEAKYPHIKATHLPAGSNKVADVVTTGQTIDVLFMSIGQADTLVVHDYQYDISELIKKHNFDLNRLEPAAVELQRAFSQNGMYGLPVFTNTLGLFYNRDIFDKFGVDYPKDGMNWDELYELAKTMARSDGETQYYGLAMSSSANIVLNQFGAAYIDPATRKANFTSEPFKKAMELLSGVSGIPGNGLTAANWALGNQQKLFPEGQSAMFLHFVVYGLSFYKDLLNWDVATYPTLPDQPGMGAQTYPTYFYVTQTSKHKEEAFEAIAYLTTEEFQNHLARRGMLPVLKDRVAGMSEFGKEVPYLQDKNINALLPERFAPSVFTSVDVVRSQSPGHGHFFNAYQKIVLGLEDINTALRVEGEALDQKLADLFKE